MKKLIATIALFSTLSTIVFADFIDIDESHKNYDAIIYLQDNEVINGYNDGTFKPDGEINRAELTKMVVAAIKDPNADTYNNCFTDVKEEWFAPYICYAKEQGWVDGYDSGKFKPEAQITRVEAMKIILEANLDSGVADEEFLETNIYEDIGEEEWYFKYFAYSENNDLLDKQHVEDNYFLPGDFNSTVYNCSSTVSSRFKELHVNSCP